MQNILVLIFIGVSTITTSQIFTDSFEPAEGYAVNDYIGPGPNDAFWTTWSGMEGGTEDAQVTDAYANTGSHSIAFQSTGGGPQDVILNFGQTYNSGLFILQSAVYIPTGKNFHWNIQGTNIPGQSYTMLCEVFDDDLEITDYDNGNGRKITVTDLIIPRDTWFVVRVEANLDTGRWTYYIDGNCVASWFSEVVSVAALDIYPLENSEFYMDDIFIDHSANSTFSLDIANTGMRIKSDVSNTTVFPTVYFHNNGTTTISSLDISVIYDGNTITENVTGLNLLSGENSSYTMNSPVVLSVTDLNMTSVCNNINGVTDDNTQNNESCLLAQTVDPATHKMVISEARSSTQHGGSPLTYVFFDHYEERLQQYWYGIDVHTENDPMWLAEYDTIIDSMFITAGSSAVDRKKTQEYGNTDVTWMDREIYKRLVSPPAARIYNGANWNPTTRELTVSVTAEFISNTNSDNYRMLCVLTEDSVSGTDNSYDQTNSFSTGSLGELGGYELLSNPVPASMMLYNRVARAVAPGFYGHGTCFPSVINTGDSITNQYVYSIPVDWNIDNINIIGMILDSTFRIDNANVSSVQQAVNNGLVEACNLSVAENLKGPDVEFKLYPNPAKNQTFVKLNLDHNSEVVLKIYDVNGRLMTERNYGQLAGANNIKIDTSLLNKGMYSIELIINKQKNLLKLLVE